MTKSEYANSVLSLFANYSDLDFWNFLRGSLAEKIRKRDFGVQEIWTKLCNDGLLERIAITVADRPCAGVEEGGYHVRCWAEKDGHGEVTPGSVEISPGTSALLFEFLLPHITDVESALSMCGINPPPGFVMEREMIDRFVKFTFHRRSDVMQD